MRNDVKLGMVISLVIVAGAGWYYVRKGKSQEPLMLGESPPALESRAAPSPGNDSASLADARKADSGSAGKSRDSGRRADSRRSERNRSATPSRASGDRDVERSTPSQTRIGDAGSAAAAQTKPKPAESREPASTPAKTTPSGPASGPGALPDSSGKPSPAEADARKGPGRSEPGQKGETTNNAAQELFKFERPPAESTAEPGTPPLEDQGAVRESSTDRSSPASKVAPDRTAPPERDGLGPPKTSPTSPAKPGAGIAAGGRTHTVGRGDTYAILAEQYYGSQRYTQFLINANPEHSDPLKLRPGVVLRVPPLSGAASRPPETKPTAQPTARGERTYVVRESDSFYRIAARELGDANRWTELFELNKDLVNGRPESLRPGQVLVLPSKESTAAAKGENR